LKNADRYRYAERRIVVGAARRLGSVAGALATVDVKDLSGHEMGRLEIEYGIDNIGDFAHMPHRVKRVEDLMKLDRMHRRLDDPERHRIRIPRLAYSMASDLVAALRPPFVKEASTHGTPEMA
jgi:uncharacterized protein (UPF0216 family)